MLEIGNKLLNKVNVDGQELTFTLVDFSDDEISGKIAIQGDFTQVDDYKTNNKILNTLLSKHQVNQRSFNYLSAATQISGLTTAQSELAKSIAFRNNFKNKKIFVQLLPKFNSGFDYVGGRVVWEKYNDDYGLFAITKQIPRNTVQTLVDNNDVAFQIWGSDYDGTYF
ncbi:hypothetical protein RO10_09360 [Streptococcus mutans]|uniref:hypothetical protein n=1 Tax=Streptococcus mutans TaxID=1309 RepID=UPI000A3ACF04|nr:hypothetical protein [Streptococcus mutans]ARS63292.1 hypothetical protein RO10_09145 [Streptococcus mutans]ARS63331.1 hypothetical protein RO10_09360 [Streptococcus mutans]